MELEIIVQKNGQLKELKEYKAGLENYRSSEKEGKETAVEAVKRLETAIEQVIQTIEGVYESEDAVEQPKKTIETLVVKVKNGVITDMETLRAEECFQELPKKKRFWEQINRLKTDEDDQFAKDLIRSKKEYNVKKAAEKAVE